MELADMLPGKKGGKASQKEPITISSGVDTREKLDLKSVSLKMRKFIKYVNDNKLNSELRRSAAFTILHGYERPLNPRRYKPYAYQERFIERRGEICLRDTKFNTCPIKMFIKEEHQAEVDAFIRNNILSSFGAPVLAKVARNVEQVEKALKHFVKQNRPISLDIETNGLDPYTSQICGVGLSCSAAGGVYIPLHHVKAEHIEKMLTSDPEDHDYTMPDKEETIKLLQKYLPMMKFIGHNMKFEYSMFKVILGIDLNIAHCTMLGEYMMDERLKYRYNLGASVSEHFPEIPNWKESKDFILNIQYLPPNRVGRYCVRDCAYTYLLYLVQYAYLNKYVPRVFNEIEIPYIKCAAEAELHGFELDEEYIQELSNVLIAQKEAVDQEIYKAAGKEFDIDSVQQLQQVLYKEMKYPVIKTTRTGISTDRDTLDKLLKRTNDEIFQHILDHRTYQKLSSTYTTGYLEQLNEITGRLHPSFMLTTTVTGRISCTNPNLQNIPNNASDLIRKMFMAPKDHVLIFADYGGQEVRVLAALSEDENLIRAYNPCYKCEKAGKADCPKEKGIKKLPAECRQMDIHSLVASKVFADQIGNTPVWEIKTKFKRLRSMAKAVTFALCYGSTVAGIANKQGITIEEAQKIVDDYFEQFPRVKEAIEKIHKHALEHGYTKDMAGRYRRYKYLGKEADNKDAESPFWRDPYFHADGHVVGVKKGWYSKISAELRQAQNYPMQGTSASMTKEAAVKLRERFLQMISRPNLVGYIHDEIVSCCLDSVDIVKETIAAIEQAMIVDIDLVGNYGFPPALPIEVDCGIGYSWGFKFSLDEYIGIKEGKITLEKCEVIKKHKLSYEDYLTKYEEGKSFAQILDEHAEHLQKLKKAEEAQRVIDEQKRKEAEEAERIAQEEEDARQAKVAIAEAKFG